MLHLPVTELPRQAEMTAGWSPAQQRPGPASLLAFCRPKQTMPEIMTIVVLLVTIRVLLKGKHIYWPTCRIVLFTWSFYATLTGN